MSYIPTNYSTNINGALVDLGQLNNNTASVNIVPLETYTNTDRYVSFPGKTVVNESAITVSMEDNGNITGNQTYTFGPQRRGMWVAVGQGDDELAYSYDGINWNAARSNGVLSSYGVSIAWNGTMWVAGGNSSTAIHLAYSYDGINWSAASSNGGLTEGYYVATNGRMWVAGGPGGKRLAYSYDGINWTQAVSDGGLTLDCRSIVWNGTMWVAGGKGSTTQLAYSYDGINWTAASSNGGLAFSCLCVAWNGTMWLAGGQATSIVGALASSPDGINWTALTSNGRLSLMCWGLAWNGVMWIACGQSATNVCAISYSYDGLNWTRVNSLGGLEASCRNIAWNGTMWIAIGQPTSSTGGMAYSYDGINWTAANSNGGIKTHGIGVAWNGALQHTITIFPRFVVAGYSGSSTKLSYSYDGKTWIVPPIGFITGIIFCIKHNGKIWVASADISTMLYSYDGIHWNSIRVFSPEAYNLDSVDFNETMWVATVRLQNKVICSYNGTTWFSNDILTGGTTMNPSRIKWNGTIWVVGGEAGKMAYSYDGINWNACTVLDTTRSIQFIEWNGIIWIAGGTQTSTPKSILYSYDGINWNTSNISSLTSTTYDPTSASWDGSRWIALCVGNSTDITIQSTDGKTWSSNGSSGLYITCIKFAGSTWIGGGSNVIKYSSDGITWTNSSTSPGTVQYIESTTLYPYTVSITPSVIGCGGGFTAITENGGKWNAIYDVSFTQIVSTSNGLLYVATGSSTSINKLSYSYDLNNWIGLGTTIFSTSGNGLACNGTMWIAVGAGTNTIAYSYNGITWTGIGTSIFSTAGNSVAWNGSMWVAVGSGTNTIATSTDGITWTGCGATIFNVAGNSVAWNGNMWLAVGYGTYHSYATSTNGIAWTGQGKSRLNTLANGVAWNGALWVAVGIGESNTIATSIDNGVTWIGRGIAIFSTAGYSVLWNGKLFIATGRGTNTVAISYDGITWKGFGTTNFSDSANPIKLSVLNNGFALNSNGISGIQNLEINSGIYNNNTNNMNINIQGLSVRKT